MSDKVRLCHSFLFCDNPNLKSRKLDLFLICYANEPPYRRDGFAMDKFFSLLSQTCSNLGGSTI